MDWQKMKINWVIVLVLFSFFSCRSVKETQVEQRELHNLSERKLFRNIAYNELNYNTMYAKRMAVSLQTEESSNNFKAIMRMERDSFIWVSLTAPLGIEVARLLLTPDSIKFINSHEKKYFLSDYTYFEEKFGVELGFECIQKMLANQFFNFESCVSSEQKTKRYKFDKKGNNYLLYTLEERALNRKMKKLYKKRQKNKEYSLILQQIEIDPDCFRPCKVSIEDVEEGMGISINYKDFKDFEGKLFPDKLFFKLFSGAKMITVGITCSRLEFDIPVEPSFRISSKYKRVY